MGWRNTRQSLQDIAEIKEAEQKEKEKQQKDIEELEQLKKDINIIIDDVLYDIKKDGNDNLLLYYYNNKIDITMDVYKKLLDSHLLIVKNKEAERHAELKTPLNGYFLDDNGHLTPIYSQVSKYNENDYNADKMRLLIDELLRERLKADEKEAKTIEKLEQKEQQKSSDDLKNKILSFMIELYEQQKQVYDCDAFRFYDVMILEEARREYIEQLKISYSIEALKAYNAALKDFKSIYCLGARPKEPRANKKKRGGVGIIGGAIAIFLGICEGLEKGK